MLSRLLEHLVEDEDHQKSPSGGAKRESEYPSDWKSTVEITDLRKNQDYIIVSSLLVVAKRYAEKMIKEYDFTVCLFGSGLRLRVGIF